MGMPEPFTTFLHKSLRREFESVAHAVASRLPTLRWNMEFTNDAAAVLAFCDASTDRSVDVSVGLHGTQGELALNAMLNIEDGTVLDEAEVPFSSELLLSRQCGDVKRIVDGLKPFFAGCAQRTIRQLEK